MPSPSFHGWWVVLAEGQPVAFVREVNMLSRVQALWRGAGCKTSTQPAGDRTDVQRLQRGEAILDAINKEQIDVETPDDRSRSVRRKAEEPK